MLLLLTLMTTLSLADSTQTYYATQDVEGLRQVCAQAPDRGTRLLCRYRLYPLTEDGAYVADLPDALDAPTAPELALLSGLWGFRAARAGMAGAIRYGLRATRLLEAAKALDAEDPYVLLIEGQSLLFRPAFAGGDAHAALRCFRKLHAHLAHRPTGGLSLFEADLWTWYTLRKLDDPGASTLRASLLAQDPPSLYRQFLLSPP